MESIDKTNSSKSITVSDDITQHACPICLNLTIEPVVTECQHVFCYICLEEMIEQENSENYFKCPMCRSKFSKNFTMAVNETLQTKLIDKFTSEYESRMKVIGETRLLNANLIKLKLLYGNTHELVKEPQPSNSLDGTTNKHKWGMFVKIDGQDTSKFISKVVYGMHPTFGCTEVEVKNAPFEMKRIGWGVFEIPIKIYWKSWLKREVLEVKHFLSFNRDGETKIAIVKVDKDLVLQK